MSDDGTLLVMILPPIGDSAALIIGDKGVQGASICWAVPSFLESHLTSGKAGGLGM
jgi:hypothetical protein